MKIQCLRKQWDGFKAFSYYFSGEGEILGHFDFQIGDDYISLCDLYVDNRLQGEGIGTEMLTYAILEFMSNDPEISQFEQLTLKVRKSSWMVKWYEKHGFEYLYEADSVGDIEFIWMVFYRDRTQYIFNQINKNNE